MALPAPHRYDLFVAHAMADAEWVHGYLLPALGLRRERVVTPEDFRLGAPVIDEFERAVASSRVTAVVLTGAFLADSWASFGERLASHAGVEAEGNVVVPLVLQPVRLPVHVDFRVRVDLTDDRRWDSEVARLRNLLAQPEPVAEAVECPYPGMAPFGPDRSAVFFGRDGEVAEVVRRLRHQPLVVIAGPSGAGASSLLQAGLVPALARSAGPRSVVLTVQPGSRPLDALAQAAGVGVDDLADPDRLGPAVRRLVREHAPAERLVVVVDRLDQAIDRPGAAEQASFLTALGTLRRLEDCALLVSLRTSSHPHLRSSPLWPLTPAEQVVIDRLKGPRLREAVEQPAAAVGVHLEPGLVECLLDDAGEDPGSVAFLQETLVLLWERRRRRMLTLDAYESLGGGCGRGLFLAAGSAADGALATLSPVQQVLARRILLRLVDPGGHDSEDRPCRRRLDSVLPAGTGRSDAAAVVDLLLERRVLTASGTADGPAVLELSHRALISGSSTLRQWIDAHREQLRVHRQLASDAADWEGSGRDPEMLYRGARLAAALRWAEASPDELSSLESEFVEASRAASAAAAAGGGGDSRGGGRPGRRITATVVGDVSGQVAVGSGIRQTVTVASAPEGAPPGADETARAFADLRARLRAAAPPELQAAAMERLGDLERALASDPPQRATIAYVDRWLSRSVPDLAGPVRRLLADRAVDGVLTAGDAGTQELRQRLRGAG